MSGNTESNLPVAATIRKALLPFGYDASPEMCEQVRAYMALLLKWNDKVNLTAISSPREILSRHFGESLFAISYLPARSRLLLDIGSGAGFPGLVLKMARPELEVTLMDPILKKVAFLKEAARTLGCSVQVVSRRTEDAGPGSRYDCVTSRAVRLDAARIAWIHAALVPGGTAIVWVGSSDAPVIRQEPGFQWEEVKIPCSDGRSLLVGTRVG